MIDREKVIKDLEFCVNGHFKVKLSLATKILALLKEQQPKTGHWIILEFCSNEGIYCSECHMKIFDRITKPKGKLSQYCPHCGSRNEQFFRDGEVVFR